MMNPSSFLWADMFVALFMLALVLGTTILGGCASRPQPMGEEIWRSL